MVTSFRASAIAAAVCHYFIISHWRVG